MFFIPYIHLHIMIFISIESGLIEDIAKIIVFSMGGAGVHSETVTWFPHFPTLHTIKGGHTILPKSPSGTDTEEILNGIHQPGKNQ